MPINASPYFKKAEAEYLNSETTEQKIRALKKMISLAPSHKGAENLRAQLKKRLAKLRYTNIPAKSPKAKKQGIKKEDMQAVLVGLANTGKSSLMKILMNAPDSSEFKFTTKQPTVGILKFEGTNIQIIENLSFESKSYDEGLTNSADTILVVITDLKQIKELEEVFSDDYLAKRIVIFNKIDLLSSTEKRKISATLSSKKYNFVMVSAKTEEGIEELKQKIFRSFEKIRVYTKEPGKSIEEAKKQKPIVLPEKSTVKDVAEKILHGFSQNVRQTKIWGPSSKFSGQVVGLNHKLKDLDIVEFKTR